MLGSVCIAVMIGFESSAIAGREEDGYVNVTLMKTGLTLVDSCVQLTTEEGSALGMSTTNQYVDKRADIDSLLVDYSFLQLELTMCQQALWSASLRMRRNRV